MFDTIWVKTVYLSELQAIRLASAIAGAIAVLMALV